MYKKSRKYSHCSFLLIADQSCDHSEETFGFVSSSSKMIRGKFARISFIMIAFCLFFAENIPVSAHPYREGGFHGHGGFEGHGYSRDSGMTYHQNNSYHSEGFSGNYRGNESYHGSPGASPFRHNSHQFQKHPQTIHPFNQAKELNHPGSFHHDRFINGRLPGHANWINHGYWHGNYWHHGYGHYWRGRSYWGPGPYWGWGNGFFYGALFGVTLTTVLFLPPVYPEYYYPPLYYYPGPYNYTVIINDYPAMPTPPLRPAPQKVETWVPVRKGHIPSNAVTNNIVNNKATYYCRVKNHGTTYYGMLIPHDGCYVKEPSVTMRFSKYDVLVSSIVS